MLMKASIPNAKPVNAKIFSFADVESEARAILEQANRDKQALLAEAKQQIEKERSQAKEEGHREGLALGLAEGKKMGQEQGLQEAKALFEKQSREVLSSLRKMFEEFDRVREKLVWQAEQDTVKLAIAIAEKVVKRLGLTRADVTAENVKSALELVVGQTDVVVKVAPGFLESLQTLAGKSEVVLGQYRSVRLEAEESIEPGGCVLTMRQGEIDAQLGTQLERIRDELVMQSE